MRARVSMLLKSRASPYMFPFRLCNKKRLAIWQMNRTFFPSTLSVPFYDIGSRSVYGRVSKPSYIFIYIHTHNMHANTLKHTYIHAHTHIRTYIRTYIHIFINTQLHTYLHTCMHRASDCRGEETCPLCMGGHTIKACTAPPSDY